MFGIHWLWTKESLFADMRSDCVGGPHHVLLSGRCPVGLWLVVVDKTCWDVKFRFVIGVAQLVFPDVTEIQTSNT